MVQTRGRVELRAGEAILPDIYATVPHVAPGIVEHGGCDIASCVSEGNRGTQSVGMIVPAASAGVQAGQQVAEDVAVQLRRADPRSICLPDRPDAIVVVAGRAVRSAALHLQPVAVVGVGYDPARGGRLD